MDDSMLGKEIDKLYKLTIELHKQLDRIESELIKKRYI